MKRTWLLVLISIGVVCGLFARGAQEKMVLRLGHIRDTNHPTHLAALKFKEVLEGDSKGRFEVKIYPNSQLGGPKDVRPDANG